MSSQTRDSNVMCPFYIAEAMKPPTSISCEGTEKDNTVTLRFTSKDDKTSYKDRYCRHGRRWEKCPLAIGLIAKYDKEDLWHRR